MSVLICLCSHIIALILIFLCPEEISEFSFSSCTPLLCQISTPIKRTLNQYYCHKWNVKMDLVNFSYLQLWESHIHKTIVSKSHSTKFASQTLLLMWDLNPWSKLLTFNDFLMVVCYFHLKLSFDGNWKLISDSHNQGHSNVQAFYKFVWGRAVCQWNLTSIWIYILEIFDGYEFIAKIVINKFEF